MSYFDDNEVNLLKTFKFFFTKTVTFSTSKRYKPSLIITTAVVLTSFLTPNFYSVNIRNVWRNDFDANSILLEWEEWVPTPTTTFTS